MPPPEEEEKEEEEEDYMSMIIEEPKPKETFTQKKLRQQREVSHNLLTYLPTQPSLHPTTTTSTMLIQ